MFPFTVVFTKKHFALGGTTRLLSIVCDSILPTHVVVAALAGDADNESATPSATKTPALCRMPPLRLRMCRIAASLRSTMGIRCRIAPGPGHCKTPVEDERPSSERPDQAPNWVVPSAPCDQTPVLAWKRGVARLDARDEHPRVAPLFANVRPQVAFAVVTLKEVSLTSIGRRTRGSEAAAVRRWGNRRKLPRSPSSGFAVACDDPATRHAACEL